MNKLKNVQIKYSSPAAIPEYLNVDLNGIYVIGFNNNKLYVNEQEIEFELLKQLFSPVGEDWNELLKEEVKQEEVKPVMVKQEVKVNDLVK